MAKRPQPGKNKTVRTQRRRVIAKKLVQGIPPKKIGEQIGLSRQMVNVEIRAAETQAFIKGAMAPYLDEIAGLIPPALKVVKTALSGPKQKMQDRLRGVKTLGYLMELAEGRKTDGDVADRPTRFAGTMEELLILYRETTVESSPPKPAAKPRRS
jgi:hypothetical protein